MLVIFLIFLFALLIVFLIFDDIERKNFGTFEAKSYAFQEVKK